jgi:hypothetical protein
MQPDMISTSHEVLNIFVPVSILLIEVLTDLFLFAALEASHLGGVPHLMRPSRTASIGTSMMVKCSRLRYLLTKINSCKIVLRVG